MCLKMCLKEWNGLLDRYGKDLGSFLLRLGIAGGMIYGHGWGKFMKLISGSPIQFPDPIGLGVELSFYGTVAGEFLACIPLLLGFQTRLFSLVPCFVMLVACFIAHWGDPFKQAELSFLYFIGFVSIFLLGSGKYSLDFLLARK